jgi:RNA polymerase sigma-70 factor (ECF subfamily)
MRPRDVVTLRVAPGAPTEAPPVDPDESFRALAREELPRLVAIARRIVGDDAEDMVQECLLRGFQRFAQLRDPTAARGWLTSILVNCCRDHVRASARRPDEVDYDDLETFSLFRHIAVEDPYPYSDSLHLDFLGEFGADDVRRVVRRLPLLYRVPLVLVYMEGFLVREVAEMLDAPVGTVLSRLHRARKLFEKQMWEYAEQAGLLRGEDRS